MRRHLLARIGKVTAALITLGALVGGILGFILVALLGLRMGDPTIHEVLPFGALVGAMYGAVLAPIAAWTLMRRVPIWRAIVDTSVGTVLGAGIGLVLQPWYATAWLSPFFLGVAGFTLAAVRLWLVSRARVGGSRLDSAAKVE